MVRVNRHTSGVRSCPSLVCCCAVLPSCAPEKRRRHYAQSPLYRARDGPHIKHGRVRATRELTVRATFLSLFTSFPNLSNSNTVPIGPLAPVEVIIDTLSDDAHKEKSASPRKPNEFTEVRSSKEDSFEVACFEAVWKGQTYAGACDHSASCLRWRSPRGQCLRRCPRPRSR